MKIFFQVFIILIFSSNYSFSQKNNTEREEKIAKQSSIIFKSQVYDFGKLNLGEEGTSIFEFKNISKKDVTITNVETSCECTGAEWPKDPIRKNGKGIIKVTFEAEETGKFNKQVFVYTDKTGNPVKLEIKGEILSPSY